jgi:hypothetical protein
LSRAGSADTDAPTNNQFVRWIADLSAERTRGGDLFAIVAAA